MCTLRAQSAVELEPDMQHITLASHTSLALAHVALATQVEFELLEGVQQQTTSGQDIRWSLLCSKRLCNLILWHKIYVANIELV